MNTNKSVDWTTPCGLVVLQDRPMVLSDCRLNNGPVSKLLIKACVIVVIFMMVSPSSWALGLGKRQYQDSASLSYRLPEGSVMGEFPGTLFPTIKNKRHMYLKPNVTIHLDSYPHNIKDYLVYIHDQLRFYYELKSRFREEKLLSNSGAEIKKYSYDLVGPHQDIVRMNGYILLAPQNLFITMTCSYLATQQLLEQACDRSAQTLRLDPK